MFALSDEIIKTGFADVQRAAMAGSYATGITAGTTQTQAGATALTAAVNVVTVVGTDGDGVILPTRDGGSVVFVQNADAGQDIKVYPPVGGAIDGGSANAAVTLGEGVKAFFHYNTPLRIFMIKSA